MSPRRLAVIGPPTAPIQHSLSTQVTMPPEALTTDSWRWTADSCVAETWEAALDAAGP